MSALKKLDLRIAVAIFSLAILSAGGLYTIEWYLVNSQTDEWVALESEVDLGREIASKRSSNKKRPSPKPPVDPIAEVVPPEVDYTPWYKRRGLEGKVFATTPISKMLSPMPFELTPKESWCECRAKGVTQPHAGEDFNWSNREFGTEVSIAPSNGIITRITVDRSCGYGVFFYDSYGALWKFFHLNRPGYFENGKFIAWKEGDPVFRGETFGYHRDFPKKSPKVCGWGQHLHLERQSPFQRIRYLAKEKEEYLQNKSCSTGRSRCYFNPRSVFTEGVRFKTDKKVAIQFDSKKKGMMQLGPGIVPSTQEDLNQIIETAKSGEGLENPYPYRLPSGFSYKHYAGYDQPGCNLYQITDIQKDTKELDEALSKKMSIMSKEPMLFGTRHGTFTNGLGPQSMSLFITVNGKQVDSNCISNGYCAVLLQLFAKRKSGNWERFYYNNNVRGIPLEVLPDSRVCIPADSEEVIAVATLSDGTKVSGKIELAKKVEKTN